MHQIHNVLKKWLKELKEEDPNIAILDAWVQGSNGALQRSAVAQKMCPRLVSHISVRFFSQFMEYYSHYHNKNVIAGY